MNSAEIRSYGKAKIAITILWLAFGIDRLKFVLATPGAREMLNQPWERPHRQFSVLLISGLILISSIFFAVLIKKISQGRRWARDIYLVFTLYDLYNAFCDSRAENVAHLVIGVPVCVLELVAMFMLFFKSDALFFSFERQVKRSPSDLISKRKRNINRLGILITTSILFVFYFSSTSGRVFNILRYVGFFSSVIVLIAYVVSLKLKYDTLRRRERK